MNNKSPEEIAKEICEHYGINGPNGYPHIMIVADIAAAIKLERERHTNVKLPSEEEFVELMQLELQGDYGGILRAAYLCIKANTRQVALPSREEFVKWMCREWMGAAFPHTIEALSKKGYDWILEQMK